MIPVRDINRAIVTPHITRMLIIANVAVFLAAELPAVLSFLGLLNGSPFADISLTFAMVPRDIVNLERLHTIFTSMFLHAGLWHLLGNMLYLYIFGDNVEGAFGHLSYLLFYLVSGVIASLVHIFTITDQAFFTMPVVGASGAISGVLGAYLILYPRAKVLTLVFYGWPILVPIPALVVLVFWFVMQWLPIILGAQGLVAYWAHVGGFVAGMVLALAFGLRRKRKREAAVPL